MRVLVLVAVAGLAWAQDDAAMKALDEGRFDAAVELLTKAVAANPTDVGSHFNLALAYTLQGKDAQAIPEYRKVLELEPDVYEAHINLGQVLLRSKEAADALPHLKKAHQQKPREFRPAYYLAESLAEIGEFADALPVYAEAAAIDPKAAPVELGWGRALARLNRREEAEPHYRKASTLDLELKSYLLELGSMYEEKGDLPAALKVYREFPDNPAATERVGLLSLKIGQNTDAIAALETVVKSSPTTGNRFALAQAYVKQNSLAQAEPLAAALTKEDPENFDLRMFYARILRDLRKPSEAAQQFQQAARIQPATAIAWSELAGQWIMAEQYPQALAALDKVKALGAETPGHMFFRATTLDRLTLRKEALEYYQRFLEASRDNPDQEFQARQRARMLERDLGKR
ncbi:MAG: tetratricopeptide repeat protein [Acidobacteriota bacterium]